MIYLYKMLHNNELTIKSLIKGDEYAFLKYETFLKYFYKIYIVDGMS